MARKGGFADFAIGLGSGYLQGKDKQREIAEAKRKALMDEKELALKERELESLNALRSSQTGLLDWQGKMAGLGYDETRFRNVEGRTPIAGDFPMNLMGNEVNFNRPNIGMLERLSPFINQQMGDLSAWERLQQQINSNERMQGSEFTHQRGLREDYPETYGGSRRIPLEPGERKMKYLTDTVGITPLLGEEAEDYGSRIEMLLEIMKEQDPEAFGLPEGYRRTRKKLPKL